MASVDKVRTEDLAAGFAKDMKGMLREAEVAQDAEAFDKIMDDVIEMTKAFEAEMRTRGDGLFDGSLSAFYVALRMLAKSDLNEAKKEAKEIADMILNIELTEPERFGKGTIWKIVVKPEKEKTASAQEGNFEDSLINYFKAIIEPYRKASAAKSIEEFEEGVKEAEDITIKFESDVEGRTDIPYPLREDIESGFMERHFEFLRSSAKKDLEDAKKTAELILKGMVRELEDRELEKEIGEDWTHEAG